jgi:type VI secretion system protein ImpF
LSVVDDRGNRRRPAHRARIPLLDRLLDGNPGPPTSSVPSTADALEALRAAVRRDLEALLNARRRRRPLPRIYGELPSSIMNYGIPDPTSGAFAVPELRDGLVREIEASIRRFEPRLSDVSVSLIEADDRLGTSLHMRISAILRADPLPEPVSFETLLEPVTRDVTVREV